MSPASISGHSAQRPQCVSQWAISSRRMCKCGSTPNGSHRKQGIALMRLEAEDPSSHWRHCSLVSVSCHRTVKNRCNLQFALRVFSCSSRRLRALLASISPLQFSDNCRHCLLDCCLSNAMYLFGSSPSDKWPSVFYLKLNEIENSTRRRLNDTMEVDVRACECITR